jgi:hypothetical protein
VTAASQGVPITAAIAGSALRVLPVLHLSNIELPTEFPGAEEAFLLRR